MDGPTLRITADDYGYAAPYDEGILAAARAGAVDAVSAMALRDPDPEPLLTTDVSVGLHLERLEIASVEEQWRRFELLFGGPPAHIDGHKHCHAAPGGPALAVARLAGERGVAVRSVNPRHRRLLRREGVATPDRLIGRLSEDEPALPRDIAAWLDGRPPDGATEWMVHPGYAGGGSSFDRGREQDLELLLELCDGAPWRA